MTTATFIVSYDDPRATAAAVASARAQTVAPDEVIVVDNGPGHPAAALGLDAVVLTPGVNLGFAGGAALGARTARADWLLFLNPDAVAAPDCVERLLAAADPSTGLVGAQVLLPDGRVNAGDNPVHLIGIAWAGHYLEPRESGPPRAAASASGAAMLARRSALEAIGGISERYFLYHEDVELSWRMRLAGWDVRFQPAATVTHDYSFDKGARKWFYLERNRAWTVLTCYSARSLVLLSPLLVLSEVAVALKARREGWAAERREARRAVWNERRELIARRRSVQATRRTGDREILARMTSSIDTPLLERPAARGTRMALAGYRRVVLALSA